MTTEQTTYWYEAIPISHLAAHHTLPKGEQQPKTGTITARNERDARLLLRQQALSPIKLSLFRPDDSNGGSTGIVSKITQNPTCERQSILTLLDKALNQQGLTLLESLKVIEGHATSSVWRKELIYCQQLVLNGEDLANYFAKHPRLWGKSISQLLHTGLKYNNLPRTVHFLTTPPNKLLSAICASVWLLTLGMVLITALTTLICLLQPLPPEASTLWVNLWQTIHHHQWELISGFIGGVWMLGLFYPLLAVPIGNHLYKLPLINTYQQYYCCLKLTKYWALMSMLTSHNIIEGIKLTSHFVSSPLISHKLGALIHHLEEGIPFKQSCDELSSLLPPEAYFDIKHMQGSHELPDILNNLYADTHGKLTISLIKGYFLGIILCVGWLTFLQFQSGY
jgi:type II secretory pathway component PulF